MKAMNKEIPKKLWTWLGTATERLEKGISGKTALAVTLCAGALLLACQLLMHFGFETPAYDLRIHEELIRNSLQGKPLYSDLLGYGFLGHHAALVFVLLAPLYGLWPSPVFLLCLQGGLLMLGGWFVWCLARRFGLRPVVSLALLCAFFLFRGVQNGFFRGFHQEVLAMVFLLGFFRALYADSPLQGALWGGLALSCREDVALFLLPVGLALCFRRCTRGWGVAVSLVSLAWLATTYLWLIPSHADHGTMAGFDRWRHYGDSVPAIVLHLATHPGELCAHVFNADALKFPRDLCFLPLGDAMTMGAIAIPWMAYTTSSFQQQAHLGGAYAAIFVPFLFVGAIRTLSRRPCARLLSDAAAAALFALLLLGINFRTGPLPDSLEGTPAAHRALAALRRDHAACAVLAQGCIGPHVGWPRTCDMVGMPKSADIEAYDIVLLAPAKDPWPLEKADIENLLETLARSPAWSHERAGCLHIFRKLTPPSPS